jgi:hypothetical protein
MDVLGAISHPDARDIDAHVRILMKRNMFRQQDIGYKDSIW